MFWHCIDKLETVWHCVKELDRTCSVKDLESIQHRFKEFDRTIWLHVKQLDHNAVLRSLTEAVRHCEKQLDRNCLVPCQALDRNQLS